MKRRNDLWEDLGWGKFRPDRRSIKYRDPGPGLTDKARILNQTTSGKAD